jgi:O-antigen/teichoic acid export membrane protein
VSSFNKKVFKGVIWSLLNTFGKFALKFFFALAITRILTPRDYGLIAYMGLFLGIAAWLSEGGFGTALIQKKDATEIDFSTAFYFNFSVSTFFFILYFFSAPFIADFFNEPELLAVMRVTSLNIVLYSLCYIHQIKLIKSIDFKKQAVINFLSSMIAGTVGLTMATLNFKYWSLVGQTLTGAILQMVGVWYAVKWKPMLKFSIKSFKEQFKFGSKVFVQGLFESVFREIHSTVIGKTYKTTSLGNYSRGHKFYDLFIVETGLAINQVLYPTMVSKTDEQDKHKKAYAKTYNILFFIAAPLTLFLFSLSEQIALVLLTDRWIGVVPFMKLYFLAGFIYMLVYFNSITVLSSNRSGLYLKMDIIRNVLMAIALLVTYNYSIEAIIIGWLVVYYFFYFVYEVKMYQLDYYHQAKYHRMFQVLVCLLPSLLFYQVSNYYISNSLYLLILNAVAHPLLYLLTMRYSRFAAYEEFSSTLKPLLPEKIRFVL